MSIIYGPVPSRRLGFSLGVDIVPLKACSLNCVYCQLGRTTTKTIRRKAYIEGRQVIRELEPYLKKKGRINFITLAGSGEPTLNSAIGDIIKSGRDQIAIHKIKTKGLVIKDGGTSARDIVRLYGRFVR